MFTQSENKPYYHQLDAEVQKLGQLHWRLGDYTVNLASLQHSKEKLISVSCVVSAYLLQNSEMSMQL